MAIKLSTLNSYRFSAHTNAARTLKEAIELKHDTAFLCHSHKDKELVEGLQNFLLKNGWKVYIDWKDNSLPNKPNKETANKIKQKIRSSNWFLFLATPNSKDSKWCPWEIGVADSVKGTDKILVIPTQDMYGTTYGNEYLELYSKIDHGTNIRTGASGVYRFSPDKKYGTDVSNLYDG